MRIRDRCMSLEMERLAAAGSRESAALRREALRCIHGFNEPPGDASTLAWRSAP
jgi:hypothetical protein